MIEQEKESKYLRYSLSKIDGIGVFVVELRVDFLDVDRFKDVCGDSYEFNSVLKIVQSDSVYLNLLNHIEVDCETNKNNYSYLDFETKKERDTYYKKLKESLEDLTLALEPKPLSDCEKLKKKLSELLCSYPVVIPTEEIEELLR